MSWEHSRASRNRAGRGRASKVLPPEKLSSGGWNNEWRPLGAQPRGLVLPGKEMEGKKSKYGVTSAVLFEALQWCRTARVLPVTRGVWGGPVM